MTRKHYKLIAETILAHKEQVNGMTFVRELTENLATILKLDNPQFDRDKFLSACGF